MNQREIAKLAGVSSATVSRVINRDRRVSAETAARVRDVISKYGYVQNSIARSLRVARTRTIGFLIPDIANPFFPAVLRGIEGVCAKHGYNLILGNTAEDKAREKRALDTLLRYRVDGLLAIMVDETGEELKRFREMGVPVVLIDRKVESGEFDCVVIDNAGGVSDAVEYLTSLGHTRIAMIHGTRSITPGSERLEGFLTAMAERGLDVPSSHLVDGRFTEEGGYLALGQLMHLPVPPTAVITANNLTTMGAFRALADMRVRMPAEVSLLGFDDFPLAGYLSPPVTVVNRPTVEMGRIACEMLVERVEGRGRGPARRVLLPTRLELRASCAPPAARMA